MVDETKLVDIDRDLWIVDFLECSDNRFLKEGRVLHRVISFRWRRVLGGFRGGRRGGYARRGWRT